jgi:hypothetical protein
MKLLTSYRQMNKKSGSKTVTVKKRHNSFVLITEKNYHLGIHSHTVDTAGLNCAEVSQYLPQHQQFLNSSLVKTYN